MTSRTRSNARRSLVGLAGAVAVAAACAQADDPSPYYVGVSAGFGHDSNVYRLRKNTTINTSQGPRVTPGDNYWSLGLLAGLDQPIGRQRLYADASVYTNRYSDLSDANYVNYSLAAGIDWETIERLSGNLNLSVNENVPNNDLAADIGTDRDLVRTTAASARFTYGLVSLLSLESILSHRRIDYTSDADRFENSDYSQNAISLGVKYRPSGALTLGSALRFTRGEFPNRSFDRQDLDLTANWIATGQSTLNARVSVGKQDNDGQTDRNFSGLTGSLGWIYRPTGKLSFNTLISRDTGIETGFISSGDIRPASFGDDSRLTTALSVAAGYELTGKIRLNALARYIRRSLVDFEERGRIPQRLDGDDTVKGLTIGFSYAATRSLLIGCNVGKETRSVSGTLAYRSTTAPFAAGEISHPFVANTANCSARFMIR